MSEIRAIVVGGVDYAEADRIVHVLSEHGRLAWFAHAARKSRRRFGGALEPFATVRATLEPRRKQGMSVIASMIVDRPRTAIGAALDRIALASYLTELCARVAPEGQDAAPIMSLLEQSLDRLECHAGTRALQRAVELVLLAPLGYRPATDACAVCGAGAGEGSVAFDLLRGGVLCEVHGAGASAIGPKTRAWVGAVIAAGAIADPGAGFDATWVDTAAIKVGRAVDALYRDIVDRPLRSRTLLDDVLGT